jgi:Domain of unknown function (DUF4055)
MMDPTLPNYQCQTYKDLASKWDLCATVYEGTNPAASESWRKYLPSEPKEPIEAYNNRLAASMLLWEDKYRQVVEEYAALLSNIHSSEDIPKTLDERLENIDQCGTALDSFVQSLNLSVEKFGGVFVLIDYAGESTASSAADEIGLAERAPHLVRYDPLDVLSWRTTVIQGKPVLTQIVIRQSTLKPLSAYGDILVDQYRVLTPGVFELWEIKEEDGKESAILIEEGIVSDRSGKPLTEIPIAYYSATAGSSYCSEPVLFGLAKLNIHLWQVESDRHNVMHKCNLPTAVVVDDEKRDNMGNPVSHSLILGPNHYVSLSKGGEAYFMEPAGTALSATKEKILEVKEAMERIGLGFLLGTASATATQSLIQATGTQANIKGMARQLNSALSEIKRLWVLFTLEEDTGTLVVDDSLIQSPLNAEMARFIVELMDGGKLSYQTGMSELQRGKVISEDIDITEEAEKLGLAIDRTGLGKSPEPETANASSNPGGIFEPIEDPAP